jgi:hypothetical protein
MHKGQVVDALKHQKQKKKRPNPIVANQPDKRTARTGQSLSNPTWSIGYD